MTDLFMVTARKIRRDSASEVDYHETCQLVFGREGLTGLLQELQKDEPHHLCRFVVEPI
jgi:hypothetical protein